MQHLQTAIKLQAEHERDPLKADVFYYLGLC